MQKSEKIAIGIYMPCYHSTLIRPDLTFDSAVRGILESALFHRLAPSLTQIRCSKPSDGGRFFIILYKKGSRLERDPPTLQAKEYTVEQIRKSIKAQYPDSADDWKKEKLNNIFNSALGRRRNGPVTLGHMIRVHQEAVHGELIKPWFKRGEEPNGMVATCIAGEGLGPL